jgi:hypothetical protein
VLALLSRDECNVHVKSKQLPCNFDGFNGGNRTCNTIDNGWNGRVPQKLQFLSNQSLLTCGLFHFIIIIKIMVDLLSTNTLKYLDPHQQEFDKLVSEALVAQSWIA